MAVAYFLKTSFKILLYFAGFYILLTLILWQLHVIAFTVTFEDIFSGIYQALQGVLQRKSLDISIHVESVIAITGGALGFLFGLKKL